MNRRRLRVADVPPRHLSQDNQIIADINSIIASRRDVRERIGMNPDIIALRTAPPTVLAKTLTLRCFVSPSRVRPAANGGAFKMERRQVRAEAALQALLDLQAAMSTRPYLLMLEF